MDRLNLDTLDLERLDLDTLDLERLDLEKLVKKLDLEGENNSIIFADKQLIDCWFDDRCERATNFSITIQELYEDYVYYCDRRNVSALLLREFTKQFEISAALCKQMRVNKRRGGKGMSFIGVRLREETVKEKVQKKVLALLSRGAALTASEV